MSEGGEAEQEAKSGNLLWVLGLIHDAWLWNCNLPSNAEDRARDLFRIANSNRKKRSFNIEIDPNFVIGNLWERHRLQCGV